MKGQVVGRGVTLNHDCPGVPYELVIPERSPENLAILTMNQAKWEQRLTEFIQYRNRGTLTQDVVSRAKFAVDVLRTIHTDVLLGICCVVIAIDPDGDVLGVLLYMIHRAGQFGVGTLEDYMKGRPDTRPYPVAGFNLLAIDPSNIPGSPTTVQLRGVGTALVAAAAQRILSQGMHEIYLHPLDMEAQRFWERRGFLRISGSLFGVQGKAALQKLVDACTKEPESPADGDFIFCGVHPKIREHILTTRR